MIGQLYQYFGAVGIASILGWAGALALLLLGARHPRRNYLYLAALGVAVLALVLAHFNSRAVSAIETDRTEEIEAGRRRQKEARAAETAAATAAAGPRFAEDAAPADAPDYRAGGKQVREGGKQQPIVSGDSEPVAVATTTHRVMKESDVVRANRFDRSNLLAARTTIVLVLLLVVWDYLARFNRTFESYLPLPIGGKWLDALSHKSLSVFVVNPPTTFHQEFLARMVRRGETFICCGPVESLVAKLPQLTDANGKLDAEFIFEAAWFGRSGVFVTDAQTARRLWEQLPPYLSIRQLTRATARRTVNLIWNLPALPPEPLLRELLVLTHETNWRLVVSSSQPPPPELAARFEEVRSC